MDLQRTSSSAPVCDAEFPAAVGAGPRYPHPDAAVRLAERQREDASLKALEAEITQLWGHINAATAHFLALLAEFDRREGWAQHGIANCAHWLSWQCGIGPVAAREKVRVARALTSLPKIAGAFGEGRLSYSKVRALTRVATAETEDTLLNIALRGTAAHVERTVRGFRRAVRHLERDEAEAMHERRYLDCWRESDGSVRLNARLAPEAGEMLLKALEAAHAQLEERAGDAAAVPENVSAETSGTKSALPPFWDARPENVSAETPRRSVSQRRADALEHILGRYLAGKCSGSANGAHEVVVHIAHDALRDVPESSGASFEHGGPVAVETARRLGCDGALVGVVEGAKGEPLAVGRRTRAVPPAIRRALRVRDGGCRFPGCDRSRYVHAHHIKHWADGGETALGNLVTLCSQHHRQVHEGGYGVRVRDGEIQFTRPDGRVLPMAGRTGLANGPHAECFRGNISAEPGSTSATDGARRLAELNAARGLNIDAHTARCGWGGERMDYNIAIDGLCLQAGYR
ncbi:MAG: DUF222 domain-containing protein [Gammaproteobacteria bacterium]|nr:DUF222 domain-containing protein [Gammaproteobacteria bacterium]